MSGYAPLLDGFGPADAVAVAGGERVGAAQFSARALALGRGLPVSSRVLNLCDDRLAFAIGLAAALARGMTTLLPLSNVAAALEQIARDANDAACLTDGANLPEGMRVIDVRCRLGGNCGAESMQPVRTDCEAVVVYTSGTTGAPLPWVKSWGSLVAGAKALGRALSFERGPRRSIVGTVPPQHLFGLETTVMLPLQWGCALHPGRPLLPEDIRAALSEMPAPRWLMTTPLHLRACAADAGSFPPLEGLICSTMRMPPQLPQEVEARFAAPLHEIYGCTEAGMVALRRPARDPTWTLCEGLRLHQKDGLASVSGGHVPGEVRLNDTIRRIGAAHFELGGRDADLIKIGGKRASLGALNQTLNRVPGVIEGTFYVPEDLDKHAGRLLAFAIAPGTSAQAIVRALREQIDPAFLPRPLLLVTELPRTALGKISHEGLRELARAHLRKDRP